MLLQLRAFSYASGSKKGPMGRKVGVGGAAACCSLSQIDNNIPVQAAPPASSAVAGLSLCVLIITVNYVQEAFSLEKIVVYSLFDTTEFFLFLHLVVTFQFNVSDT